MFDIQFIKKLIWNDSNDRLRTGNISTFALNSIHNYKKKSASIWMFRLITVEFASNLVINEWMNEWMYVEDEVKHWIEKSQLKCCKH